MEVAARWLSPRFVADTDTTAPDLVEENHDGIGPQLKYENVAPGWQLFVEVHS